MIFKKSLQESRNLRIININNQLNHCIVLNLTHNNLIIKIKIKDTLETYINNQINYLLIKINFKVITMLIKVEMWLLNNFLNLVIITFSKMTIIEYTFKTHNILMKKIFSND